MTKLRLPGNRLWFRLWLAFGLVLIVAVMTAAVITHQSSTRAFQFFVARGSAIQQQRLQQILERYHDAKGDWSGVTFVLESLGPINGKPVVLYDLAGRPIADSDPTADLGSVQVNGSVVSLPIRDRNRKIIGEARVAAGPVPLGAQDRRSQEFQSTLGRSLFLGALAGGLVALIISLVVSRRIVAPIEVLTKAVRQLGTGDLDQRVTVKGMAEIGELGQAFNIMAEQLARDQRLRRQVVADLAHELRTPLANVRGYLEALRDGVLEARPDVVSTIHEEAIVLQRLLDDLQELSMVEAGQLRLERQPTEVAQLLDRAVTAAQAAALAKSIGLTARPAANLPAVDVDENRIAQVLRNLLANAITYTPAGGRVSVVATAAAEWVAISVTDSGPGISPDDLPYIFERFYRTDQSRARATGGVGLGLTIARQLVLAQGGTIEAQSAPGQGATFTFRLPVSAAARSGGLRRPAAAARD